MKREFHFPTILGVLILLAGTVAGIVVVRTNNNPSSQASGDCSPGSLQVTNVTDKSVDITFITTSSCSSTISLANRLINDVRNPAASYSVKTHYFQIDNLNASTDYTYQVISGGQTYTNTSYKITTAAKPPGSIPVANVAWGKIYNSDNSPASSAIIYINIPGASPLSSYVTTNGNWNIALATSLDESHSNWFTVPPNTNEDITVISENNPPLSLTGNTNNNNPVPDIIIGQTTDLNFQTANPTTAVGVISVVPNVSSTSTITITSPKDGEFIAGKTPQFIGTATPNSQVQLSLTSAVENLSTTITAANDGGWGWSLTQDLIAGQKTLTASSGNATVSRQFYVSDTISGPAFVASPSATDVPTPPVYYAPTAVPTDIPTLTPTAIVRRTYPATNSGMPATGNVGPTIITTTAGIVVAIIGLLLFK